LSNHWLAVQKSPSRTATAVATTVATTVAATVATTVTTTVATTVATTIAIAIAIIATVCLSFSFSLRTVHLQGKVEKSLLEDGLGFETGKQKHFQFTRRGYFCVDLTSTSANPVLNRTTTLRE
jgi:hypothetical protein